MSNHEKEASFTMSELIERVADVVAFDEWPGFAALV
jgi:hypothetical protein